MFLISSNAICAYDFEYDGIYYNITSVTDFTAEVTSGDKEYSGDVVIPSTVIYKSKTLKVTSIGDWAFGDSAELTSINIPNSITDIGSNAFNGCFALQKVTINCTIIDNHSFSYSSSLKEVIIGDSVKRIMRDAFYNCYNLINVKMGNNVTEIGDGAFYRCSKLNNITIPDGVTSIGDKAFLECSSLPYINIPQSVEWIGSAAFHNCIGLKKVEINCDYVQNWFSGNTSIKEIVLGNDVLGFASEVTKAFEGCTGLETVTIGSSISKIRFNTFSGCTGLKKIYLMGTTPPIVDVENFTDIQYVDVVLYVPVGTLETYQKSEGWGKFWDIREFAVTGVYDLPAENISAFEKVSDGVVFTNLIGKNVTIYTVGGVLVENIPIYKGESVTLDKGIYILRVGNSCLKFMIE